MSIHQKNLQLLAIEIFKFNIGIASELMNEIFQFIETHSQLINTSALHRKRAKTMYNGNEALSSLAPKIWELTPNSLKEETSAAFSKTTSRRGQKTNACTGSVRNT